MLDENMVPEWRDQYLDYNRLNSALNKAIESKNIKSREKGVDLYFELIKFNQKFACCFSRECQAQLDKINSFHKEKLNEMKGKYNNLQDQLDQILNSAIYREILPDLSKNYRLNENLNGNSYMSNQASAEMGLYQTVSSISELFKNIKGKMGKSSGLTGRDSPPVRSTRIQSIFENGASDSQSQTTASPSSTSSRSYLNNSKANPLNTFSPHKRIMRLDSTTSLKAGKKKVSSLASRITDSFNNTAGRLSSISNIGLVNSSSSNTSLDNQVLGPAKLNCRTKSSASISSRMLIENYFNSSCSPKNRNSLAMHTNGANGSHRDSIDSLDLAYSSQAQTMSAGSGPTKKKIIASYKKKITHLKFAFRELYFNLVLFEQYTQLNYNGFEQILRKHDRMFASALGRKFYQEHVQTADFYMDLQAIDHLIEGVEHIYTLHFENGNRRKAIEKLQVPTNVYKPSSPMLDFRVGYELGMFAVLFILVLVTGLIIETSYDWRTVFKLFRSPLLLIIILFQAGISILIWKHYKINHVLIFELNPRNNLSFQHFIEFGSLLGIIWSISVLLFLFSEQLGIKPSLCPLIVITTIVLYLFNPTATCYHQARFWLLRILVSKQDFSSYSDSLSLASC